MKKHEQKYDEPLKNLARTRVLSCAVSSLTTNRSWSALVSESYFKTTLSYVRECVINYGGVPAKEFDEDTRAWTNLWRALHKSRVGKRRPSDLKVLILCGPQPLNDFNALLDLGISPLNVWAIEGDKQCFDAAVDSLKQFDFPFKVHLGSLQEFFAIVPQQFDLVYFDACGPFTGGQPGTLPVLRELFVNQRLSEISALITNFAGPADEPVQKSIWAERLATWFAFRDYQPVTLHDDAYIRLNNYRLGTDGGQYIDHVTENLENYYGEFVSSFISEFAAQQLPSWRALALPSSARALFANETARKGAIDAALSDNPSSVGDVMDGIGSAIMSPSSYACMWPAELAKSKLPNSDALRQLFCDETIRGVKLADAVRTVSVVRNFRDFHERSSEACSAEFASLLANFRWIDSPGMQWHRMFCDTPQPHLLADLLIGQAGYPYHVNLERMQRFTYRAKTTTMHSDVFVLAMSLSLRYGALAWPYKK